MHGFTQASVVRDGTTGFFALYRWNEEEREENAAGKVKSLKEVILNGRQAWTHRAPAPRGEQQIYCPTHAELKGCMGAQLADFGGAIRVVQLLLLIEDQGALWRPTINVRGYKAQALWDALFRDGGIAKVRSARREGRPFMAELSAVVVGSGAPEPLHPDAATLRTLQELHRSARGHAKPFAVACPVIGLGAQQELSEKVLLAMREEEADYQRWSDEWPDPPAYSGFGFHSPRRI